MQRNTEVDVLVIGAGPVGMTAAAVLAEYGVRLRIVDRRPGPDSGTRCTNLWPATLDAMAFMGLDVGELLERSQPMRHKVFHLGEDSFSSDLTEYGAVSPVPLTQSQDVVDAMLTARLERFGVAIEYGVEACRVDPDDDGVTVVLRPAGPASDAPAERVRAGWLVAAQGMGTGAEELLGVRRTVRSFPGVRILHADARLENRDGIGPDEEHIYLAASRSAGLVPLPGGLHRLFLMEPDPAGGERPGAREIVSAVARVSGLPLTAVEPACPWWARPESRIAETFRLGRVLLAGGSATALPLTVHGMNNGMQDAFNLAWKLGMVVRGLGDEVLLDSYTVERRRVARKLVEVTERVLGMGTSEDSQATHGPRIRQGRVDMRTQPSVTYRQSPLSQDQGRPGGPQAGDPMPGLLDLAAGTRPCCTEWTLLVPRDSAGAPPVPLAELRALADKYAAVRLRLTEPGSTVHLVRPDGHIAFRGPVDDPAALAGYAARFLR
ncbi:FAD-dependent monooxygenase [Thermomonospora cellulosilytica]|uniref:2-polyprenyl-6-methoxyphenol hydroxylase-like FAD-dependent oxidoreductase n=1 Tax=Thermomonospora cellulosilytica TaxID=1411118 RepID=A0A7W3N0Y8_9ACTN|nr:FAD-dependent monooxygenase [Thermomonospora cellulosilytica]MBA9005541.1 2-polyprenyl-6-methoxyphenol hydroxylase-like FAD-dependent oxidoreductase [Thermomonospora cellulosilytica]